ncbi:MAG: hypothetical protein KGI71_05250 [Patescibacteria group bacterium]|nr:hypothetical protein [Patescibacteria group bacterium]
MGRKFEDIIALMRQRRTADAVLIQAMIENRDRYDGDVVVLQPDVSGVPAANRPGPNFFQEAIDGNARLANSTMPKISVPVRNPGNSRQAAKSELRQGALYGRWYESQLDLKLGRAYRHLAAYGTCAFIVVPDDIMGRADIQIRDPLTAFPELRAQDDIRAPQNCGFLFARSAQWIEAHFPNKATQNFTNTVYKGWDTLWDVVEWVDEDDIVIGLMGPRFPAYGYNDARPYGYSATELARFPNKAGMVPVAVPRRVTLDRIMGQLTSMINYSDLYGRMLSLQLVATEKSIFPDMVLLSRTGLTPQLVSGKWQDGRTGNVNIVLDGTVETIGKEPGPGTIPMLQLVDQHIRGSGGASPLYAGQASGMRTGAGVDALGDFGVNPMVAESQMVMERTLEEVNRAVFAVDKGYFGSKTFTVVLGLAGSAKTVTFTPDKDFDDDSNVVAYVSPGADPNKLAVAVTQLASTEIMSKRTARQMHPLVQDPDEEEQFVALEKMSDATLAAISQEVASGQTPTALVARAAQHVAAGETIYEAWLKASSELATQGPAPGTPGGPPPTAPGAGPGQPGQPVPPGLAQLLASQGAGPQAAPGGAIPGPNPSLMNFRHVLQGINEQVSPGAT